MCKKFGILLLLFAFAGEKDFDFLGRHRDDDDAIPVTCVGAQRYPIYSTDRRHSRGAFNLTYYRYGYFARDRSGLP